MKETLTVKLNSGDEVFAKIYAGALSAVTYTNRRQAKNAIAKLGPGWEIVQRGRPFYIRRVEDRSKSPLQTPWGVAQDTEKIAEGIYRVSTASHGGFYLSKERFAEFEDIIPNVKLFAGPQWFEEDQDWAYVALAFPQYFTDGQIYFAVRTAIGSGTNDYNSHVTIWLEESEAGKCCVARSEAFKVAHWDEWQLGSYGGGQGRFTASFTRVGDGSPRYEEITDWPDKTFYTDSELEAIIVKSEIAAV